MRKLKFRVIYGKLRQFPIKKFDYLKPIISEDNAHSENGTEEDNEKIRGKKLISLWMKK